MTGTLSKEDKDGIGIALNEATLCGLEFSREKNLVGGTFSVVTVSDDGTVPDDNRVQIIFYDIGKIYASYRDGRWDDKEASVIHFGPENLLHVTEELGVNSIYGWDFIDCNDEKFDSWKSSLSMQYETDKGKTDHTIDLFQEGLKRHLDLRIYFGHMRFFRPDYTEIPLDDFITGGRRAWDSIHAGDRAVQDAYGIYPLAKDEENKGK